VQRLISVALIGFVAWQVGALIGHGSERPRNALIGLAMGVVVGYVLAPNLVGRPVAVLRGRARAMPAGDVASATVGLILGLVVGVLLAFPLSLLPWWIGRLAPLLVALTAAYVGVILAMERRHDIARLARSQAPADSQLATAGSTFLVDTSAIIDGRIADIAQAGFVYGTIAIPRFVLTELQHIADSPDANRRQRGRRGLEILHRLQKEAVFPVEIVDRDVRHIGDVDGKLVHMARDTGAAVITNDYNLNQIAELQGVHVLNINQLANALKPMVMPGEDMRVQVIQEGKEQGQGLAYLDDGTMIVVEGGKRFLHSEVDIVVTRVLQTSAGRMVFAQPRPNGAAL
jgi:uncharacterized protein YacL